MFPYFNHSQLERYLTSFGLVFNRLTVARTDASGGEQQRFVVPIHYAPKSKWFTREKEDPNFTQGVAITVPQMSYQITGFSYDGERKAVTMNQVTIPGTNPSKPSRLYAPVPYKLTIQLSLLVKNQLDGLQIVEQIFPLFTPDLAFMVNTIPGTPIFDQVVLSLLDVRNSDNFEGDISPRREITWDLTFEMRVNFWGPSRKQSRIEQITLDFFISTLDNLQKGPDFMATEDGILLMPEDGGGHLATEDTPDGFLKLGQVMRIEVDAIPPDQEPESNVHIETTFTEYTPDVRRDIHDEDIEI